MEIKRSFTVNKPVAEVWDILGNDYGGANKWATGLYHTEGYGKPTHAGAPCSNRTCETAQGTITEAVRTFDAQNYHLAYEVIEGFPGFVESGVNNWRLTPQGEKTKVDIHFIAITRGLLGSLMAPMMKWQLGKTFDRVLGDFKYYVEHGKPSPAKEKENAKREVVANR